ncbi:MAG: hypothetical protein K0S58_2474 [Nitrospira sp.]|jgi:hypothetical protein|nr:hypothetical protein [Nitrospira sp.]
MGKGGGDPNRLLKYCFFLETPTCGNFQTKLEKSYRMFKKAVQRGRSDARRRGVPLRYVELPSDARTKLADFFNILLDRGTSLGSRPMIKDEAKK